MIDAGLKASKASADLMHSSSSQSISSAVSSPRSFAERPFATTLPHRETHREKAIGEEGVSTYEKYQKQLDHTLQGDEPHSGKKEKEVVGHKSKRNSRTISDRGFLTVIAKPPSEEKKVNLVPPLPIRQGSMPSLLSPISKTPTPKKEGKSSPLGRIKKMLSWGGDNSDHAPETPIKQPSSAKDSEEKNKSRTLSKSASYARNTTEATKFWGEIRLNIEQCTEDYYKRMGATVTQKGLDKSTCIAILRSKTDVNAEIVRVIKDFIWRMFEANPALATRNCAAITEMIKRKNVDILHQILSPEGILSPIVEVLTLIHRMLNEIPKHKTSVDIEKFKSFLKYMITNPKHEEVDDNKVSMVQEGKRSSQTLNEKKINFVASFLIYLDTLLKNKDFAEILWNVLPCTDKRWKEVRSLLEYWSKEENTEALLQEMEEVIPQCVADVYRHFTWFNDTLTHITKPRSLFVWDENKYLETNPGKQSLKHIPLSSILTVNFEGTAIISKTLVGKVYQKKEERFESVNLVTKGDILNSLLFKIYKAGFEQEVTPDEIDKMVKIILEFDTYDTDLHACYNFFIHKWVLLFLSYNKKNSKEQNEENFLQLIDQIKKEFVHSFSDPTSLKMFDASETLLNLMMALAIQYSESNEDATTIIETLIHRFEVEEKILQLDHKKDEIKELLAYLSKSFGEDKLGETLSHICDKLQTEMDRNNLEYNGTSKGKAKDDFAINYKILNNPEFVKTQPILFHFIKFFMDNGTPEIDFLKSKVLLLRGLFLEISPPIYNDLFNELKENLDILTAKNPSLKQHVIHMTIKNAKERCREDNLPTLVGMQKFLPGMILSLLNNNVNYSEAQIRLFAYRLSMCRSWSKETEFIGKFDRIISLLLKTTQNALTFAKENIVKKTLHELYKPPLGVEEDPRRHLRVTIYPYGSKQKIPSDNSNTDSTASSISPRSDIFDSDKHPIPARPMVNLNIVYYKVAQRVMYTVYPIILMPPNNQVVSRYPLFTFPLDVKMWSEESVNKIRMNIKKCLYKETRPFDESPLSYKPMRWHPACQTLGARRETDREVTINPYSWKSNIYSLLEAPNNPLINPPNTEALMNPNGNLGRSFVEMTFLASPRSDTKKNKS
jgi:predicted nucleic-acid-binding protein